MALVGEHLHIKLDLEADMLEIMFLISMAEEVRDRNHKNTQLPPEGM